jgi:iron complex outermembrane receptor protein
LLALLSSTAVLAQPRAPYGDLTQLSIEDLLEIEVTSVSRKEESLFQTASAVYVITQEDIRRSGATRLPELLRLAPGVQVARIDSNKSAVTVRGFAGRFSNKLLVLIDGRTIYTPLFSGVYWEDYEPLLDDIERIEVIRGPGSTMWGANAVNGVINIITKRAADTRGGRLTTTAGNHESGAGSLRYGASISPRAHYRVYSSYFDRNHLFEPDGQPASDDWRALQGGFRLDWDATAKDSFSFYGNLYDAATGTKSSQALLDPPFREDVERKATVGRGDALVQWTRKVSPDEQVSAQFSYEHSDRDQGNFAQHRNTTDLDFQYRRRLGGRHDFVGGGAFRLTTDELSNNFSVSWAQPTRTDSKWSGFLHDEITLSPGRLRLALGSKFEHNGYSGFEWQPTAKLAWTPTPDHTAWLSVARAVRTPSRVDHDIRIVAAAFPTGRGLSVLQLTGSSEFESEKLVAYEAGYRTRVSARLSFDLAAFYNDYDDLVTREAGAPFFRTEPRGHFVMPLVWDNLGYGETYGAEAAATWVLTDRWKLNGGYSWLEMQLHTEPSSTDTSLPVREGESPAHQFHVRSYADLGSRFTFDSALYAVSSLTAGEIPAYARVDVRLGWQATETLELDFTTQNLFDARHAEFLSNDEGIRSVMEVGRSVFGRLIWRF